MTYKVCKGCGGIDKFVFVAVSIRGRADKFYEGRYMGVRIVMGGEKNVGTFFKYAEREPRQIFRKHDENRDRL